MKKDLNVTTQPIKLVGWFKPPDAKKNHLFSEFRYGEAVEYLSLCTNWQIDDAVKFTNEISECMKCKNCHLGEIKLNGK